MRRAEALAALLRKFSGKKKKDSSLGDRVFAPGVRDTVRARAGRAAGPGRAGQGRLTRRARLAVALEAVHQVDAAALVQAGAAVALVDLVAADGAHVARAADAGVRVDPVLTLAVVAGVGVAVVDVLLAQHAGEPLERSEAAEA